MTEQQTPTSIRRVESDEASTLTHLVASYDDVQTVLRCCEQLVALVDGGVDTMQVEALWTLGLLSYARLFADHDGHPVLTEDDVIAAAGATEDDAEKVRQTHRLLLHLRDHHADPGTNPRETFTAGVALGPDDEVNAVAVTSVPSPTVDATAPRQAGAIAYSLVTVLDQRIEASQAKVLEAMRAAPKSDIEALELIEVAATG